MHGSCSNTLPNPRIPLLAVIFELRPVQAQQVFPQISKGVVPGLGEWFKKATPPSLIQLPPLCTKTSVTRRNHWRRRCDARYPRPTAYNSEGGAENRAQSADMNAQPQQKSAAAGYGPRNAAGDVSVRCWLKVTLMQSQSSRLINFTNLWPYRR